MARSFRKEIKEPDSFQAFADKALQWYQANTKPILAAAAAVVVAVAAFFGYRAWNIRVREQAGLALAIAETIPGPEAENALRKAAERYPGTKAGIIARLHLAALLGGRGDHQASEREYRALIAADGLRETDLELARRGLAGSLSRQGNCAEAIAIWRGILDAGSLLTPEDLYISIGACLEGDAKAAEALKAYEELIEKHPGSPFITLRLRARMDRLSGK